MVMNWISVEDELPEDQRDVLVVAKSGDMYVGYRIYTDGAWAADGRQFDLDFFTHWMPLPEGPGGKKSDV